ncbi:thymidylate kinase [Plantactinospora soyae]|uniref:Thymidylate kinase n=1 Tax=Plantactinospora soyae TaxID=1544732 RepID=A0A927LZ80_9ACTN|nr:thymidylate kinase [Plantactinospora soyae]
MAPTLQERHGGGRLRSVALVGIDGSGKTTQAHRLADALTSAGVPATYWQNAGGRRWFSRLARKLGRRDAQRLLGRDGMLFAESALRWMAIARALLRSRLHSRVAVMDRYAVCQYASIRAHGGGRRWEGLARVLYRLFPPPDVTFLLAVEPGEAYRRIEARGTDHENIDFLAAGVAAYRSLPEFAGFVVVDANRGPDEVTRAIQAGLRQWLPAEVTPPDPTPTRRPVPHRPEATPTDPTAPPRQDEPVAADPLGTPDPVIGPSAQAEARTADAGAVRPGRTPVWSRRSSAPTRRWPESESPRRSPPVPPNVSDPRWAQPPGWPACR